MTEHARRELIRRVAADAPKRLRATNAGMAFEDAAWRSGISEVGCPACGDTGLIDARGFEACPLCHGMYPIYERLAEWFEDEFAHRLRTGCKRSGAHVRRAGHHKGDESEVLSNARFGRVGELRTAHLPVRMGARVA